MSPDRERARRQRAFRKGVKDERVLCEECGKRFAEVADHDVPVTMGGDWTEKNRRKLCPKCHGKKIQREQHDPFMVLEEAEQRRRAKE